MNEFRVLFLSAEVGAGHNKTAQAVANLLPTIVPNSETMIVDFFGYVNPIMRKALVNGYMEMIKTTPGVYGYLYDKAEDKESLLEFNKLLNLFSESKLKKLLEEFDPDILVSTHAFPSGVLSVLKKKDKIKQPIATIITDFTAHPFWIYPNMDLYIVGHKEIADILIVKGVNEKNVYATGIPIDPGFKFPYSTTNIKEELGLEQGRFTILIAGGGLGLGPVELTVKELAQAHLPIQLIVMVGRNGILKERLNHIIHDAHIPIAILDYVDNVNELMVASDLLVSKPGGLTCAETLTIGLPLLILKPIPGQEERNADFLTSSRVAIKLSHPKQIVEIIRDFLMYPHKLLEMRERAITLGKPNAAEDACWLLRQAHLNSQGSEEND